MVKFSDVSLVFADLEAALVALEESAQSPKDVRRNFGRFVDLSQRLTSIMRKEYASMTGNRWQASNFPQWNEITTLFKELRNEEQHERPIFISVNETREYEPFGPKSDRIAFSGTWELAAADQLMASPPDGMKMFAADKMTGVITEIEIPAVARSFVYIVQARSERLRQVLESVGSSDVHELSRICFRTLSDYYAFYRSSIRA